MKVRELLEKITDERRYGHLMILYFSSLDKEINDVLIENINNPDYLIPLRNVMKQFGIKEEGMSSSNTASNTVYFDGNGREVLEIMKMALCGFKDVYIINAFLHPHHGLADEGRATLDIIVNIPTEQKWIDIHYHHHESDRIKGGYGNISYIDHYYHLEPFPEDRIRRWKADKYNWGYSYLTGEYILNEILEKKKCI